MSHSALKQPSMEKVEPVFFRNSSVIMDENEEPKLKHYEVIEAISRVVRSDQIHMVQIVRGLWRIYMKSKQSRATLITRGVDIRHLHIQLYDTNPYRTNSTDPSEVIERVTFKDLAGSVDDSLIMDYIETLPYEQKSKLQYARARNRTNQLTDIMTGDRYILLKGPIVPVLPNRVKIGQFTARVYHDSQFKVCKACGNLGHRFKDPQCPAYDPELNALLFRGHLSPLSNSFKIDGDFVHHGKTFDSAQKAYNWRQAMHFNQPGLAEQIRLAEHGGAAKILADKNLPSDGDDSIWDQLAPSVMQEVIKDKMDACDFAKSYLLDTGDALLGEASSDLTWACGLWEDIAQVTLPRFWKGKNKLGRILMELRSMYRLQEGNITAIPEQHTKSDNSQVQLDGSLTEQITYEEAMQTVSDDQTTSELSAEPSNGTVDATMTLQNKQATLTLQGDNSHTSEKIEENLDNLDESQSELSTDGLSSDEEVETSVTNSKSSYHPYFKSLLNKAGLRTQTPPPSPKPKKQRKRKTSKSPQNAILFKKPKPASVDGSNTTIEEDLEMMKLRSSVDDNVEPKEHDPGEDWD